MNNRYFIILTLLLILLIGNLYAQTSTYNISNINNNTIDKFDNVTDMCFINLNTGYITASWNDDVPNPAKVYNYLYKTTNSGINWTKLWRYEFPQISHLGKFAISMKNEIGYFVKQGSFNRVLRTSNGGANYMELDLSPNFPNYLSEPITSMNSLKDLFLIRKAKKEVVKIYEYINHFYYYTYSFPQEIELYHVEVSQTNNIVYVCGRKHPTYYPFLAKSTDAGVTFTTILDGNNDINSVGSLIHMSIINNGSGDIIKISGANKLIEYNTVSNNVSVLSSTWTEGSKITFSDANNGFYMNADVLYDDPPLELSNSAIYMTTNNGQSWLLDFSSPTGAISYPNRFYSFGNIVYFTRSTSDVNKQAYFYSRNLNKSLATYHDNISSSGSIKINNQTPPFQTPSTINIRGGSMPIWTEPVLNQGQPEEEKVFYRWSSNEMINSIPNYNFFYDGELATHYKTKLKADNAWAINNASGSKSVRDKNGNVNTIHESIGGIFFTKSYNNGSDFKTEEIVNDNKSNNNQFSVSNNTNPHLNEIKKEISIVHNLSPERNMIAVWENRNGSTITINTATREKTIDLQKYYWKRDEDNTFNITSNNQSFYSHPKVFSQVMGITAGFIDTTYFQMKIITYLEPGANGNDLKAKVQYKNGSVDKNQTYTIVAGADFTDFACVSDIYKTISGTILGFNLHYSYKKNGNVFYKKETIYYETSVSDLVRIETNEENISSFDLYYQKSNPDITLRNGAPAISYTGRYQENRSIEWDNGGSGPSTLSTTYYPVVVKFKKYGVTGWTKIVYNSNGFGTQENANVEGSKDTSAYIVNYSKNSTLFNQFVQIDGKSGYSCSPGAFSGSDAKLVRGGYNGQFGSGSNPLLLKLNYPVSSRYTILHSQFSILPNAIEIDGYSNLDGVIEKDNTLYSLTLGPIIASNTTYGFEDDTPPQTVQNPVEFNETMVSAVFTLSNYDTLILGANGKYTASFTQVINPLKYHVNLVNASSGQIHRELFKDTIKTEDSIGIEFLRGYVINNIDKGTDQFYIQMIVDTVDAGDGNYNMAGVYADDTPPQGDAPINYKTKVFFENSSNSLTSGNQIPKEYSLSQNYPNPFNPSTTIKYSLPKDGFVSLKIYDITGREVKSLANEVKKAGYYSVTFNASNLASGVYFYRIQSNDFVQTKRMVLIK